MAHFAVLDSNDKVVNIIIAETKEIAEQFTGKVCIEYTQQLEPPSINDTYVNGSWIKPEVAE